jgi:hypothetical protein
MKERKGFVFFNLLLFFFFRVGNECGESQNSSVHFGRCTAAHSFDETFLFGGRHKRVQEVLDNVQRRLSGRQSRVVGPSQYALLTHTCGQQTGTGVSTCKQKLCSGLLAHSDQMHTYRVANRGTRNTVWSVRLCHTQTRYNSQSEASAVTGRNVTHTHTLTFWQCLSRPSAATHRCWCDR